MKNESGFTLVEMLIVMLVISILLFITIPNVTHQSSSINKKGCSAFIHMVEGQVQSYEIDNKSTPLSMEDLVTGGYLRENETSCPNGTQVSLSTNGEVVMNEQ